jgi:hypothetical protein
MTDKTTCKPDPMGATDLPKYNGWPPLGEQPQPKEPKK